MKLKNQFREKVIRNKGEWRVEIENCQNAQQLKAQCMLGKIVIKSYIFFVSGSKDNAKRKDHPRILWKFIYLK